MKANKYGQNKQNKKMQFEMKYCAVYTLISKQYASLNNKCLLVKSSIMS